MSVLPLRLISDPVLRTPSDAVGDPAGYAQLVEDMLETQDAVGGVGLAAPQVGAGVRIFTWDDRKGSRGHVVNPELAVGEEPAHTLVKEGCLSVPEVFSTVAVRRESVRLTGTDVHGEPVDIEATGLLATIFQHEMDHLEGKLFVDRLEGEARREARAALRAMADPALSATAQQRAGLRTSAFGL